MAERAITTLLEGGAFFEGPRWHDGRWWVSDFYRHLVLAVGEDGSAEEVMTVEGQPSGLGWLPDGSLLVGTSANQRPVVRVEQDGSSLTALPSGNVGGPVVAVGATADMMYITDSKVLMRMPLPTRDSLNWREVPGQQGVRAAPVVPRP